SRAATKQRTCALSDTLSARVLLCVPAMTLDECISEIKANHFPNPPASPSALDSLASSFRWPIPSDLRSFFLACNGARLFEDYDSPFDFVPIEQFHSTAIDVFGEIKNEWAPSEWYSIAHVRDGNFISIDLATVDADAADYLDAFHETRGYQMIIARSFTELLSEALTKGGHFWLEESFVGHGYQ
ncbi:MAG: SMI1/KNR4 family protein, partial [Pirellulaceae bacterium]|nr:SMI1/KNR4 family protein [Pirellulaceae bacterium]